MIARTRRLPFAARYGALVLTALMSPICRAAEMEWIRVSDDKKGFVFAESKKPFAPWGFNYDHDESGRLIEDYWEAEWDTVVSDFKEMKELGANVVRIHLQFGKFMDWTDKPNAQALEQLKKLLDLSDSVGLYLDITGLGCYHKRDVPEWYDKLSEADRWQSQCRFWEAVAEVCKDRACVFCYDLMNEPVVSGGPAKVDWLGPAFGDKHFVQYVAIDHAGRERPDVARAWVETLVKAIRKRDSRHLITVGLVPWSLDRPGLTSGFVPPVIAEPLDFLCVHIYPERGKLEESLATLRGFTIGKPVVVEEIFPLKCSTGELDEFITRAGGDAAGWIGFYWGKTPAELKKANTIKDAIVLAWLEYFEQKRPKP